jgi:hypothetical protein
VRSPYCAPRPKWLASRVLNGSYRMESAAACQVRPDGETRSLVCSCGAPLARVRVRRQRKTGPLPMRSLIRAHPCLGPELCLTVRSPVFRVKPAAAGGPAAARRRVASAISARVTVARARGKAAVRAQVEVRARCSHNSSRCRQTLWFRALSGNVDALAPGFRSVPSPQHAPGVERIARQRPGDQHAGQDDAEQDLWAHGTADGAGRKAGTSLALASTPVSALQPDTKAFSSSRIPTAAGALATTAGWALASAPGWDRASPVPITTQLPAMNTVVGSRNARAWWRCRAGSARSRAPGCRAR